MNEFSWTIRGWLKIFTLDEKLSFNFGLSEN
jgi:hypothetical protein